MEKQIEATKTTLVFVEADRDEKQKALEDLKTSRESLETELQTANKTAAAHKNELDIQLAELLQIKEEVSFHMLHGHRSNELQLKLTRDSGAAQTSLVSNFQEQLKAVEAELASTRDSVLASRASHDKALAEAGAVEREALQKAQEDFKAIKAESEALGTAYSKAQEEAAERIKALEDEASKVPQLATEAEQLKRINEELQVKLSETEVEVLELRESVEKATDDYETSLAQLKSLEKDIQSMTETSIATSETLKSKEEEHDTALANLKELESKLATALEGHSATLTSLAAQKEEHEKRLAEIQRLHEEASQATSEKLQRVTMDLEVTILVLRSFIIWAKDIVGPSSSICKAGGGGEGRTCQFTRASL